MRKILIFSIILSIVLFSVQASETETETKKANVASSSLNLVMPDDTLSFGFSDSDTGIVVSETPVFYLWKYDILTGVTTTSHATEGYSPYVLAKAEFYVWYDAFVGSKVKLVLTVPQTFTASDNSSSIDVATYDTPGVNENPTETPTTITVDGFRLLEGGEEVCVVELDGNCIYKGREKYCVALDISDAKKGVIYTGEIKLEVKAR